MKFSKHLKIGLFLTSALLFGRVLGLVREFFLAGQLGTTSQADMAIALITLPDIFITLFLGNAVAAVFLPKIQNLKIEERYYFFTKLSQYFFILFLAVSIVSYFLASYLSAAILPAQSGNTLFVDNLKFTLIALPFLALNSVSRVFLQNEDKFNLIGLENILFNLCIILSIGFVSDSPETIKYITFAVIAGSFLRWFLQFLSVHRVYNIKVSSQTFSFVKSDLSKYLQALSTGLIMQMLPLVARSLSSFYNGEGALASFNYVFKITEFPVAFAFSILSTLIYPQLSRTFTESKDSHTVFITKISNFLSLGVLPLGLLIASFLMSSRSHLQIYFKNLSFNLDLILVSASVCFILLFVRFYNEFQIIIINSMGHVKYPFRSTLMALPIGLTVLYFATKSFGLIGAFAGLNVFYIFILLFNTFYLVSKFNFSLSTFFNITLIKSSLISFIAAIFLYSINTYINIVVFGVLWTLIFSLFLLNFYLGYKKYEKTT